MRTRFFSSLGIVLVGGFLLVTSQAFAASTFSWLMLGSGVGMLAIVAADTARRPHGAARRALAAATGLLGAWTIVASMVFGGAAVTWLGFGSGGAALAFALAGLILHELSTERVVHSFELRGSRAAHDAELAGAR